MELMFSDAKIEQVVRAIHDDDLSIMSLVDLFVREQCASTKL